MSASARGAAAPRTGAGQLHRQCFASVGQCAVAQSWPRLACASCWISRRLRLGLAAVVFVAVVALARYGHPLRFYIRPHFVKWSPVAALKLRFVSPTAARPHGFTKQALCKVACAGVGRTAVGAPRSVPALRAAACTPWWLSWHLGISQALRAVFWSVACGQSCGVCPRPPTGASPLRGIGPRAPVCPSAPTGAPSVRRKGMPPGGGGSFWSGSAKMAADKSVSWGIKGETGEQIGERNDFSKLET